MLRTKETASNIFHDQKACYITNSGLKSLNGLGVHLELRDDHAVENNIQFIVRSYNPVPSPAPAEFDPFHNQVCGAWIEVLPFLSASGRRKPFILSAISTLATALRHHSVRPEPYQSLIHPMYFDSLKHMGKALGQAHGVFRIEHCIAIMCLAVTNILTPMLESSWMTHARGVGDLMKYLEPETFSTGIFHSLFVGFRPLLLVSSILSRQETFLAKEEWTTIPFRGQPVSMMQQLLNRASVLPSLLERYHNTRDFLDITNLVMIERIYEDFQDFLRSLQEWEIISESNVPFPLVWSKPNTDHSSPSVSGVLWFPNIMTANSLMYCWAFKIIAKTYLSTLNGTIATLNDHPSHTVSETGTDKSVVDLAEMICHSIPYLIQPGMELHHAGSSFFPLPTAIEVFQRDSDRYKLQLLHCKHIVNQLTSRGIHFIHM